MSILPQIAAVCICECAISEVWTCFRFDRICFRERAQNQTSIRRYRAMWRRWSSGHGKQKPDDYINVTIELDDMDITSAETKATYDEI